jgi:hypothetical protein
VLGVIRDGELPPPGTKRMSPIVTMDGPVAVGRVDVQTPDGSVEPQSPAFLVRRDGRWKVVIDFFEGGGLTEDEMNVIDRYVSEPR